NKYRVLKKVVAVEKGITFLELFEEYVIDKKKSIRPTTFKNKYLMALNFLRQNTVVGNIEIDVEEPEYVDKIIQSLKCKFSEETALAIFVQFQAFITWAIKLKKIKKLRINPLTSLKSEIKPNKRKKNDDYKTLSFSADERDEILNAIATSDKPFVRHYYNYYSFLFYTGCRPSEAIAVVWDDIIGDYEFIRFNKAITDSVDGLKELEGLKTQDYRLFPINNQVKDIFIKQKEYQPNNLKNRVFTTQRGKIIETRTLRSRVWQPILSNLKIDYKKPYSTRHTFITLSLEAGMDVKDVTKLVGNSPITTYKHYASTDIRQIQVPNL
ncbi:MAG: site-specific integrase, partial [Okeania sp. SIO2D1]|nr:site-specific integrase [Okeania sp. SIO2D1]